MKKSVLLFGFSYLVICSLCTARTYNTEITLSHSSGEFGGHIQTDLDTLSMGGKFFLTSVDTSDGPLQEAAFLSKASSVAAVNFGNGPDFLDSNSDIDGYSARVNYITPGDYIFGGHISKVDLGEYNEFKDWELSVGKYINDHTTLTFSYRSSDSSGTDAYFSPRAFGTNSYSHYYTIKVTQFSVLPEYGHLSLEGTVLAVNTESNFDSGLRDDSIRLGAAATYYPVRNLGLGLAAQLDTFNSWEIINYKLHGSWFATETLSLDISYETDDNARSDIETDMFSLGASFRF